MLMLVASAGERLRSSAWITSSSQSVNAFTLTANLKSGPLTVIPEFRLDGASDEFFFGNSAGTELSKSASQFLIGAVYAF